jgi:hypothetical protein
MIIMRIRDPLVSKEGPKKLVDGMKRKSILLHPRTGCGQKEKDKAAQLTESWQRRQLKG